MIISLTSLNNITSTDVSMQFKCLRRIFIRRAVINERVDGIIYRNLAEDDSLEELTLLINRAYQIYADMGLNYVANDQEVEKTRKRISRAICLVALDGQKLIGTITYKNPKRTKGSDWYNRASVSKFNQLAVDPEYQKKGIGRQLLDIVERIAKQQGAIELALDTSEDAEELINYYKRKKYRFIEYLQWDFTNYRSVVLSKKL